VLLAFLAWCYFTGSGNEEHGSLTG